MNKIIVYDLEGYGGLSREFTSDVPDLHSVDFGDCISSLKVIGQPWVAFREPNFKGTAAVFEEGLHDYIALNNQISSLQLVTEDLEHPQITLYEHPNYEGASKVITEETNLTYGYFNDRASSHIVQKGVWILYEHPARGGWFYVAREGTKLPNYGPTFHFHNKLSHAYPLKGGRPIITAKIKWDAKKVESEREVVIDEINAINATELEQTLTSNNSRIYETATTHSFKLTIPDLQVNERFKLNVDPKTTFTVEKGHLASTTTVDKVEVTVPAKIPKYSEMNVQMIMKQVTASVPVDLIVVQNGKSKTEQGEYRTMSGRNVITKYTVKPIEKKMLLQ